MSIAPTSILAHGIGERGDLPLPLYAFTWGLGAALVVSFFVLGVRWPEPRLAKAAIGRPLVAYHTIRPLHLLVKALAVVFHLVCLYAALVGANDRSDNIVPVTVYVTVWVGMALIAGLVGDLWGAINPFHGMARVAEWVVRGSKRASGGPTRFGHWPATVGMAVFLFYELSHPNGADPRALGWLLAVHTAVVVVTGAVWGADWVRDHEPMSVLFDRLGAMGPVFFRPADPDSDSPASLALRAPMAGLAVTPVVTGTVAFLLTVIGGTSFDGFSEGELGRDVFGGRFGWELAWVELPAMLASIAVIAGLYAVGVWWTTRVADISFVESWRAFGPSLIPIAFGYSLAHYFQLFSDEIQSFVFRLSDPFGRGWDLFGGSDGQIWRIDPDIVAWVQVVAILIGHVGAVIVAHDRAVERFPLGRQIQSQFAMLLVMVAYSTLGLWLLLAA